MNTQEQRAAAWTAAAQLNVQIFRAQSFDDGSWDCGPDALLMPDDHGWPTIHSPNRGWLLEFPEPSTEGLIEVHLLTADGDSMAFECEPSDAASLILEWAQNATDL